MKIGQGSIVVTSDAALYAHLTCNFMNKYGG